MSNESHGTPQFKKQVIRISLREYEMMKQHEAERDRYKAERDEARKELATLQALCLTDGLLSKAAVEINQFMSAIQNRLAQNK